MVSTVVIPCIAPDADTNKKRNATTSMATLLTVAKNVATGAGAP